MTSDLIVQKWRCDDCDRIWKTDELLTAPNPFEPSETVSGCPNCKTIGAFTEICDEPECKRIADCGFPTKDGYRRTCYKHSNFPKHGAKQIIQSGAPDFTINDTELYNPGQPDNSIEARIKMMIKNESCMETMAGMPDKAVQCIITSPPYNMNLRIRNGKYCSRQIVKEFSSKYDGFDDNMPIDDFYLFHHAALSEMLRVSPLVFYNIAIVTGSKRAFFNLMGDFSDNLKDIIVWDKGHGQPAMQSGVMNRQSELILVFSNDAISRDFKVANFKRGTLSDTWAIPRQRSKIGGHRATFPEKLVETILDNFTRPGDLIYDPFMGSGTVLATAKKMGRHFIGSEINKDYCDAANRRMTTQIEDE